MARVNHAIHSRPDLRRHQLELALLKSCLKPHLATDLIASASSWVKMSTDSTLPSKLPDPTIHITSHDSNSHAKLHSSSPNKWTWYEDMGVGFNVVYTTSAFPPSMNDEVDIKSHEATMASGELGLVQKNGTVCRIVDFSPEGKPHMHRTQSLDYGIVLFGEVIMELDDGSITHLKQGDVAVQRGTNHSWRNPSTTAWSRMLFVLQDSQPLIVNGQRFREEIGSAIKHIPNSGNAV